MVVPVRPAAIRRRPSGSRIASSVRCARTSSTRSRTSRRATNRSARSESMSAQCASSTTMTTGAFCSRSASTSRIRAPTPTGSSAGSDRSRPARSRADADARHAHELVDDAERDERLPLLAGGAQHGQVRLVVQDSGRAAPSCRSRAIPRAGRPAADPTGRSRARPAARSSSSCRPTKEWALSGLTCAPPCRGGPRRPRVVGHLPVPDPWRGHEPSAAAFDSVGARHGHFGQSHPRRRNRPPRTSPTTAMSPNATA